MSQLTTLPIIAVGLQPTYMFVAPSTNPLLPLYLKLRLRRMREFLVRDDEPTATNRCRVRIQTAPRRPGAEPAIGSNLTAGVVDSSPATLMVPRPVRRYFFCEPEDDVDFLFKSTVARSHRNLVDRPARALDAREPISEWAYGRWRESTQLPEGVQLGQRPRESTSLVSVGAGRGIRLASSARLDRGKSRRPWGLQRCLLFSDATGRPDC